MSSRLTLRIQERLATLTGSEQKLGRLLLAHPELVETHTATELAGMASISKSTAARFFQSLGYRDFDEVKAQARDERNQTAPFRYSESALHDMALGYRLSDHLALELDNLTRTVEEMLPGNLASTSSLINSAPRVWFAGFGLEASLAHYGRQLLSRYRHDVLQLGVDDSTLAEELAMMGPRDVLVLLAVGKVSKRMRILAEYAQTTRVNIVAICDYAALPSLRRFADRLLPCHAAGYALGSSHIGALVVLRLMTLAFLERAGDSALQRHDIIDGIRNEFDR